MGMTRQLFDERDLYLKDCRGVAIMALSGFFGFCSLLRCGPIGEVLELFAVGLETRSRCAYLAHLDERATSLKITLCGNCAAYADEITMASVLHPPFFAGN